MAFKIEERFDVQAPVERVWKYMIDPKRVVECLPGAQLLEQKDDQTFLGAIKVKVGPLSMSYKGQAKFTEINEQTHQVRMMGDAREAGGSGSTKVSMPSTVAPLANGSSEVLVNADIDLVGKIVQFGRGMIERSLAANVPSILDVRETAPGSCRRTATRGKTRRTGTKSRRRRSTRVSRALGDHRSVLQPV